MKRVLFITGLLCLLLYLFFINKDKQSWSSFWGVSSEKPSVFALLQNLMSKEMPDPSETNEDNSVYIPAQTILAKNDKKKHLSNDQNIKYKLEMKPFGGINGETQFDYTLR